MPANDPGWHPDPASRHQYRWWDGSTWTDQVADDDVRSTDPLASGAGGAADGGAAAGAAAAAAGGAAATPPEAPAPAPDPQPAPEPATSVTPQPQPAPAQPAPAQPAPAPQPATTVAPQPVAAGTPGGAPPAGADESGGKSKLPIIIGVGAVVVIAAAAAFFLLGGDDESDGTGEFTASIEGDDGSFVSEIKVEAGDAVGVTVETSSDDLDPVLVIAAIDDESITAINGFETDELGVEDPEARHQELADLVREDTNVRIDGEAFDGSDDSGAGDEEGFGLTFPVGGTFSVTVAGFEDTEGDVKVTIAKQSTKEDLGDNPSADDIDALTTGEHEDFLSDFTDAPTIFADIAGSDPDPAPDPDPVPDPEPDPDPGFDGGDLEAEAIDLLTTELTSSAGLSEPDARCVSTNIIETIGVAGLAEIGLAAGEDGEFTSLSDEDQAALLTLITGAFGVCGIAAG